MTVMRGVVARGRGEARAFTQLAWVREQFRLKFGFDPYPGTLNVRVEDVRAVSEGRAGPGQVIEPGAPEYCAAKAIKVQVGLERVETKGEFAPAVWIIPEVPGYPDNLVELMAEVSLRDALGVGYGDTVLIQFFGGGA